MKKSSYLPVSHFAKDLSLKIVSDLVEKMPPHGKMKIKISAKQASVCVFVPAFENMHTTMNL